MDSLKRGRIRKNKRDQANAASTATGCEQIKECIPESRKAVNESKGQEKSTFLRMLGEVMTDHCGTRAWDGCRIAASGY